MAASTLDSRIRGLHTRRMELHSLGGYRLLEPVPTLSSTTRCFLACLDSAPEGSPPTALAKVLMPGEGEVYSVLKAQFAHEANLLRSFSHPGIPSLRAAGTRTGVDFFVMDYIAGVDLGVLLGHESGEPRPLSKELAVYILGQLADALRYVHTFEVSTEPEADGEADGEATGEAKPTSASDDDDDDDDGDDGGGDGFEDLDVLHRDLCPANVYLSLDGDVILGDFGSATSKWLAPEFTSADAGHVAYKAPERVTGSGKATVKSDLFSLGVILWEILRGERCFTAGNELETMDEIVRFDISHSSRRVSGLSSKLSEVLRRNLDRDPERRYPHAYKVLQRLSQSPEAGAAEKSRQELSRMVAEAMAARVPSKPR
ncbi:putative serine/threonine-protein kinase pknL [Enhygromyxa salina]|uniref:Putative serine/threonine-protein kinase pknL n=1 Tax=Enhygromyxa salina TaxID=215803 RepID=A0A0C2A6F8_9BACT|nr:serine/threonine-protein kinase [Enhygromyxa salina]KIG18968.1 putative serine/threonine-protein kinase pknL [Enhygromyxa salina]